MEKDYSNATVTATVTLKIKLDGKWAGNCPVDQVYKGARDSALFEIDKLNKEPKWKVIGEPKISIILLENENG